MNNREWRAKTRDELIIEVWEALDCDSVGAIELTEIQRIIGETFGRGAVESPAAIARTLAGEGAVLRHPEVLECDATWRAGDSLALAQADDLDFSTLESAALSIKKLDALRLEISVGNDRLGLRSLLHLVAEYRQDLLLVARSKVSDEDTRIEAREVALWLAVWLQQPELFVDWLSLRTCSPKFLQKFGTRLIS